MRFLVGSLMPILAMAASTSITAPKVTMAGETFLVYASNKDVTGTVFCPPKSEECVQYTPEGGSEDGNTIVKHNF